MGSKYSLSKTISKKDLIDLWTLACRSRALSGTLKKNRDHVYGACLLGILQENVSLIPMFVLHKMGIFLGSIKNGDHRTLWEMFVMADFVNTESKNKEVCDLNHVDGVFRNHFGRMPHISKKTGEPDSNGGRDGNTHSRGCPTCRIIGLLVSDMGRLVGLAAGYGEAIASREWAGIDPKKRPVSISFHGEGAEQQGVIHETRNRIAANNYTYASLDEIVGRYGDHWMDDITKELLVVRPSPHIQVINANEFSLFTDAIEEHGNAALHLRASGYGNMKGYSIHDWDIPGMINVFEHAIRDAQQAIPSIVVVRSYRGTAHNEDQIAYEDGAFDAEEFGRAKSIAGLSDLARFHEAWEKDPVLVMLRDYIETAASVSADELDEIYGHEKEDMHARAARILEEPHVTLEHDKEDRSWYPAIDWGSLPAYPLSAEMPTENMGYNQAFAWITGELMKEDDRVVYFGEDVYSNGVLGLTKGIGKKFGPKRIWNMPISEEDGVLNAAGLGLYGLKPILEFQFGWFGHDADPAIECMATQWYQKKLKMDFVMVYPCGIVRSGGSAQYHEEWPEKNLWETKGTIIVAPANAREVVGIMRAAYACESPVAVLLQISAANLQEFSSDIPSEPYAIPIGKAQIVREGTDVTVIAYGAACVSAANNEAEFLAKKNISVHVVNPLTLRPLDLETLRREVIKTGRLIVMHEASEETGIGSEILTQVLEDDRTFYSLLARPRLVCAGMEGDLFIPTESNLIWARLPYHKEEVEAKDAKNRTVKRIIHRSKILHERIVELMEFS